MDMFKKKKYHVILMGEFLLNVSRVVLIIHRARTDLIMPVMSGTEATQEIRRIEAEHRRTGSSSIDSIIIALTASTLTEDHQMAMKAGCNDFILKPVSLRWLERKVREWGNIQGVIDYQNLEEAVERKYGDKK